MSVQYNQELNALILQTIRRYPDAKLQMMVNGIGDNFDSGALGDDVSSTPQIRVALPDSSGETDITVFEGDSILTLKKILNESRLLERFN
jgi:hypothetical protein